MKTYINPTTDILRVENYLCQNAASPIDSGYHPLGHGGQATEGQSGAM